MPWLWALAPLLALWALAVTRRWARARAMGVPLAQPASILSPLGHLGALRGRPLYLAYQAWARRYGPAFLIFFGKNPVVVLSDPDLIRQVGLKQFVSFHDRPSFVSVPRNGANKRLTAIRSGLLVARGGYWGSLRAAMNPLFHTGALHAYGGLMNDCVGRFLARLGASAAGGRPLDAHELLGRMTMEVIGRSAFGVEFDTDSEASREDYAAGRPNLVAAAKIVFGTGAFLAPGGGAALLFRLLPDWAEPLLFNLLFTMVGALGRRLEYARSSFMAVADQLMQAAKRAALARGERLQMRDTDWRWWPQAFADASPYKGVTPAPNSAIDLLMRATNKETGQGLADVQIAAQCNTLIAAGYETTANALSFAIYCLATHPEAEARLLAEVDAFGGREPGPEHAAAFPFVDAVVREALRLYPPAHVTTRECTAAGGATLAGPGGAPIHIPQGTWVHIPIWTLHHSEQHWEEPEAFRPERFLAPDAPPASGQGAYLPFGLGPRNCIGYKFALQEMRVALVRIYQQYTFSLAPQQERPLPLRMGITLSPADGMWVTAHPRPGTAAAAAAAAAAADS